ncbi:MAG: PTS sugar transporter subunit IIA [Clostridiales bacterium]|nr:PTS sugar transporter subunit IIA [Clostridiales bacterium]
MNETKTVFLSAEGSAENSDEAIRLCGRYMMESGSIVGEDFTNACIEREKEYPTGLPTEVPVAMPHGNAEGIRKNCVCFLRLDKPVRFQRMDDSDEYIDTKLIFNIAIIQPNEHMEFLKKFMKFVMDEEILKKCSELPLKEIPTLLEEELG